MSIKEKVIKNPRVAKKLLLEKNYSLVNIKENKYKSGATVFVFAYPEECESKFLQDIEDIKRGEGNEKI